MNPFAEPDLPESTLDKVKMLERLLIAAATGGSHDDPTYGYLRRDLMDDPEVGARLPSFVRQYRTLSAFWPFIKEMDGSYAGRRQYLTEAFTSLIDELEAPRRTPGDAAVGDTLIAFNADGVAEAWRKALARRTTDPEGAITAARSLLETVLKHVLDDRGVAYTDKEDLPKLYDLVAAALHLAPSQHTEEAFRRILGGATSVVNGLATLRNRLSDSHGKGSKAPVRPSPRHATLAVNMAGTLASFIVETHLERRGRGEDFGT